MPALFSATATSVLPATGLAPGEAINLVELLSTADTLTAHAGGAKSGATAIATPVARFTTVTTAGDSALLPPALAGMKVILINGSANVMKLYGAGTDTINGVNTATALVIQAGSILTFYCVTAGAWLVTLAGASANPITAYDASTGHKAIPVPTTPSATAVLTKSTAGTDYTLGTPVATVDDNKKLTIFASTAAAHVVTAGAGLINAATSGVATFGGAIGDSIALVAYQGVWYTDAGPRNVVIT